ncbi:hypothetical protein HPSA20_1614 [Helicobacter pylori SouthAfrica20]|uniref:Uncharacterized protein n=1 Tax=Helicobacter pylori SouthAfrica20 TaxID=1352356 RepID=T1UBS1_HELPX|nr:hypothetical protein HPSA20_1614 [Helicobacter pylori SouthAfrica20]
MHALCASNRMQASLSVKCGHFCDKTKQIKKKKRIFLRLIKI